MKIKVYTFATDDDNGTDSQVFGTEAERDAAIWEWLAEQDGEATADELRAKYEGDYGEAYDRGSRRHLDTMNWDDVEVEIPDPVLPPALVAPIEAFCDAFGGALHREEDISGADAVEALSGMWPLFHAAQKVIDADPVSVETERAFIGVRLEGGMVQDVFSNRPDLCPPVFVIDYDTDDVAEDRLTHVPQDDGPPVPAILQRYDVPTRDRDAAWFEDLNKAFDTPAPTETADDDDDAGEDDEDEDSPFNQNRFTNYYECSNCGTEWTDNWSCECNDRCPKCNREIEPYQSEENEEA